jgi:hypothetical protein
VQPGQVITLHGVADPDPELNGTLGNEIDFQIEGKGNGKFATDCSSAIGAGAVDGEWLVVSGSSTKGGPLCPVENGFQLCGEEAPADAAWTGGSGGHAFWLPGIDTDLIFDPESAQWTANFDGTATLTGTLVSTSDSGHSFQVSVDFAGLTSVAPPGSPKKELGSHAYSENGGPVNSSTWVYYTSFSGTLTGQGDYAGAVIEFTRTGPAFQVGVGANGKNISLGGSGWFTWTVTQQPSSGGSLQSSGQGDINIDLVNCTPPPPCDIKYKTPTFSSRTMTWNLTNDTADPLEISYIYIWWPSQSGNLKKVRINSTDIWSGTDYPNEASISNFINGTSIRTLQPGQSKNLRFQFSTTARPWTDKYYMYVEFKNGCSVEWKKK